MMLMTMTMRMQRLMKMLKTKMKTQVAHPKSTELHAQLDICLLLLLGDDIIGMAVRPKRAEIGAQTVAIIVGCMARGITC